MAGLFYFVANSYENNVRSFAFRRETLALAQRCGLIEAFSQF
jgi:hypothetical protein